VAAAAVVALAVHGALPSAAVVARGPELLQGSRDHYGGIILDPGSLPAEASAFTARLDSSLAHWRAGGVRGVWMEVPIDKSHLIGIAVDRGFQFHHAEPGHCMMTAWLPDTPSPLPPNPSHHVGVGALCVNEKGDVLLVQERSGPFARKNLWKPPTGLLDTREDISDGVEREVFEETGIRAKFEKVLAFRHGHSAPWGKSDLYFICLLRVRSPGAFKLQKNEIQQAKWAPFQEFLDQAPYPRDNPVWAKAYARCVGPDGVVGNVEGIRMSMCPTSQKRPSEREVVFY